MKRIFLFLLLAFTLAFSAPATATISTPQSSIQIFGNGITSVFSVNFVPDSASNIAVIYTNASGVATTLSPSQYSIAIPPTPIGQLWPSSFNLTYPISGSPIASNTSLTISRIIPLTQTTALSNQGNFYPKAVEAALDTTLMQLQQVSARTGQQRGTWISGAVYNFGDVVQNGANGSNSGSYYMCAIANTSGVWATDLANGDWSLVIQSVIPIATLPLSIGNGGTGQTTAAAALTALGGISVSANNTYTGSNNFTGGSITVPTQGSSDSSARAASTSFVASNFATLSSPTFSGTVTASGFTGSGANLTALPGKQLVGTTTNDNANSGNVGEYISATVDEGSAISLTTNTAAQIATISLTAGDWDVWGQIMYIGNASTTVSGIYGKVSLSSAETAYSINGGFSSQAVGGGALFTESNPASLSLAPIRISINTTTSVYLNAFSSFAVSTCSSFGGIYARRVR